uniref:Uncharacterized protein n=1 Tax=viral metagenome TaxID=1070528 RepID=A0A6C0B0V3_9ZZZZ
MFKQILITMFLFIVILVVFYFLIKYFLISTHKLYLDTSKIKYLLHDSDKEYLKKYSNEISISQIKEYSVFFTTKDWNTSNNNYLKFKERYYIIEPGYYYYILPDTEMFLNNKINVFLLKKK